MCWPALYTIRKKKAKDKMFDRPKSPKDKYQTERTIRVDTIPPPYRSTYVMEPTFVPVNSYHENLYYVQERERERGRERERERTLEHERAIERGRRPSCSDLFHNIDVIQRLGERFKGLNTTFSHPPPPPPPPSSNSNAGNNTFSSAGNSTAQPPAQTTEKSSNTAALTARIKELEKEKEMARDKEIEKLNGGLNGVRGELKGLQMKSEREEGRREGRMEGIALKSLNLGAGSGYTLGETWIDTSGELGRNISQMRGQNQERDTRRKTEVVERQRGRDDDEFLWRRIDDRIEDKLVGLRERERDNERGVRMDRFEDKVEGRVGRVEDRIERIVEREIGRAGESERDRERGRNRRERSEVGRDRFARPRLMRERERDWEYGYEDGRGYGGLRYRGYV